MRLNHLHISVPNAKEASTFYERYFGFKFAFSEADEKMVFLRDESDFLLALHDLKTDESVNLPAWHHFGFRLESKDAVRGMYEEMRSSGIQFASELKEGEAWATFLCWAPGPYRVEVSWDAPEH